MSVATQHGYQDAQNGQTFAGCLPYMCGADQGNESAIMACAIAGYSGVFGCTDPACAPYCPNQRLQIPATVSKIPAAAIVKSGPPILTPQNIVSPIPDITRVFAPVPLEIPCSPWAELNQSIMDNPVIAAGLLGLAFFVLWKGKR